MSVILYTIEPRLFLVIVAYAFVGTTLTVCLGKSLVPLNFERLQYEADLRYSLVRLREHAESIAFYRGESTERTLLSRRLDSIVDNQTSIIRTERTLEVWTQLYQYMTWVLPIAVVAPSYFAGALSLGSVTQARSAFVQVTADLSIIIKQFNQLSSFSAGIDRLSSFYSAVREADNSRSDHLSLLQMCSDNNEKNRLVSKSASTVIESKDASRFACSNLTLQTPNAVRTLIYNLTLSLPTHHSFLLITGPSGVGKSSLLRAIGGLWTAGTGIVERPPNAFFLPQQPYCTQGTLRQQLMYPKSDDDDDDDGSKSMSSPSSLSSDFQLITILNRVGLSHLNNSLLVRDDWSHRLSLGEQQRLAFGRILLHQPTCCLLDEATSALDLESEQQMYRLLQQTASSFISVGHRPTLYQYHTQRLNLLSNGGYEISDMDEGE